MKKKLLSTLMAAAVSVSMLAGCATTTTDTPAAAPDPGAAPQQTEAPAEPAAEPEGSSTETMTGTGEETLHVFLYMQEHEKEIYQQLIDEFVKEHSDQIKELVFEVTTQDEYNQ